MDRHGAKATRDDRKLISTSAVLGCLIALFLLLSGGIFSAHAQTPLPRTIYALYDSHYTAAPRVTNIHRFAEMPLNHLGFILDYRDVNQPLPEFDAASTGILVWFEPGTQVKDPVAMLSWLEKGLDAGKKLVIMGDMGINDLFQDSEDGRRQLRHLLHRIGVEDYDKWNNITYRASIIEQNKELTGMERQYGGSYPPYNHTTIYGTQATSQLKIKNYDNENNIVVSDLIITHPNGGYIADGYVKYEIEEDGVSKIRQWYINPFAFFTQVLGADSYPKPDVTTLDGNRIFYSHMDGDGWNSLTEVDEYRNQKIIAADVLRKEVFERYKDIPFSVSVIVDDMDTSCYGLENSATVARQIFALPNIEPSSHTWSHPLEWEFFADYTPRKEKPLLHLYPQKPETARSIYSAMTNLLSEDEDVWEAGGEGDEKSTWEPAKNSGEMSSSGYDTPRSYACTPFDINQEITGAVDYIQKLAPKDKKIKLLQWSGDTSPYEEAIRLTRENHILNINGGDTRLDREYPSYAYVAPIGVQVGKERQIYSSNSNENTYTNLWTDRFFGFQFLTRTARNTETPLRVTPFNIYFHTYSGSKKPSLEALKTNINYAISQDIIPIQTSDYAAIADAFYATNIIPVGPDRWQIENRGALQTIRFDLATLKTVNWEKSNGVIGQNYLHGSLYVSLDPEVEKPVIAIKPLESLELPVKAEHPYLIRSRWKIKDLHYFNNLLSFSAQGFGHGTMELYWPGLASVHVRIEAGNRILFDGEAKAKPNGLLILHNDMDATQPVKVTIEPQLSADL